MKSTDMTTNGKASASRASIDSTPPQGGITNVSEADNMPVMMNKPGMLPRGSRADALIEMAGDDSYRLGTEAPRFGKIKG